MDREPWHDHRWQQRTRALLDSFRYWLGRDLIPRSGDDVQDARRLFEAPFIVLAHGTQEDPILDYLNRAALELFELELPAALRMPSRMTAEPQQQAERARMLQQAAERGFVDDYQGIRKTATGRRFRIRQAVVWNVVDAAGRPAGQAATFDSWQWLDQAAEQSADESSD